MAKETKTETKTEIKTEKVEVAPAAPIEVNMKPGGLGKAGAIINIICGVLMFYLIYPIFTIVFNLRYLRTGKSKTGAGIFGIFTSFLGGIFVLVDTPVQAPKK